MAHAETLFAHRHRVAVFQPVVGQAVLRITETGTPCVLGEVLKQEQIIPVRAFDLHARLARQFGRAAGMIQMAMREQDLFQRQALLCQNPLQLRHLAAPDR